MSHHWLDKTCEDCVFRSESNECRRFPPQWSNGEHFLGFYPDVSDDGEFNEACAEHKTATTDSRDLETVRLAIAICKAEVEQVLPPGILETLDAGSPWARAYMKTMSELKSLEQADSAPLDG